MHEEEKPLLEKWKQDVIEQDQEFLTEVQEQEEAEKKRLWDEAQELRQILADIKPNKDSWVGVQMKQRKVIWNQQNEERLARIKHALKSQKILRARERQRKEEKVGNAVLVCCHFRIVLNLG